jgi:hypothetical protein
MRYVYQACSLQVLSRRTEISRCNDEEEAEWYIPSGFSLKSHSSSQWGWRLSWAAIRRRCTCTLKINWTNVS